MQRFFRKFITNFKEYIVLVLLLIISLTLLSANDNSQIKNLKTFALGGFAFLNSVPAGISNLFNDDDELIEMKRYNAELMLQVNKLREYGLENNDLKMMLDYKQQQPSPLISSAIISKLVSKIHGNFIIDVGASNSVDVGMPVINPLGLVGIVTDVSNNFSVVRTLYNSNLALAVVDQRSNVAGIMDWNGIELVMKNIPTTYDVAIGDRIVTSEFSTIFPPAIPVGVVVDKETNISGLLNNITVRQFVDISSLKNVFVLQIIQDTQIDSLELNLLK